jgi:hypothetical protein
LCHFKDAYGGAIYHYPAPKKNCRGYALHFPGCYLIIFYLKTCIYFFQKRDITIAISTVNKGLRVFVLAFLFLAGIGPLLTEPAMAEDARLTDIVVTNTHDHLLLYFTVTDCFTENMQKAIDNGVNTTFTFFVNLHEVRSWWWDKKIADLKVSHEIKYDSLKKVYQVRLSSENDKVVLAEDFNQAKRLMAEIVGLKVTELRNLHRGNRYQINMMAELDTIKLPFYFHYVFFFLSLWDFETDWYSVDFRY